MFRKSLLFHLLFLLTAYLTPTGMEAQEKKEKKEKDDTYVLKYDPLISIRPFSEQNFDYLVIQSDDQQYIPLYYRAVSNFNFGGQFSFKWMSFTYAKNLPLFLPELPQKFQPDYNNYGFAINGRIFGMTLSYTTYDGFYTENTDYIPDNISEEARFRSDISSQNLAADFRFTFSDKVSAKAIFDQSERQIKSAGAFTMQFCERYHNFAGIEHLVPWYHFNDFEETDELQRLWVNNIQIMPGYGYVAVAGNWNFGLFMYVGSGIQVQKYYTDNEEDLSLKIPTLGQVRGGITYNSKYFYARVTGNGNYTSLGMKDARLRWFTSSWELSMGLRLYAAE